MVTGPSARPCRAKSPNSSGMARPEMVLPPVTTNAAPEKIVSVASVATNGRMPMMLTSTPLSAPPTSPTSSAIDHAPRYADSPS